MPKFMSGRASSSPAREPAPSPQASAPAAEPQVQAPRD
jgi:hypothetical protein